MAPADDERDGRASRRRRGDSPSHRDPWSSPQEPDPRRPAPDRLTGEIGRHSRRPAADAPPPQIRRREDVAANPDDAWGMSGYPSGANGVDSGWSAGHDGGRVRDGAGEPPRNGADVTSREGALPLDGADSTSRDDRSPNGLDRAPRNGSGPGRNTSGEWGYGIGHTEGAVGPGLDGSVAARNGSGPARGAIDQPHDGFTQPHTGSGPSPDWTGQPRNGTGPSRDRTTGPRTGAGLPHGNGAGRPYNGDGPPRDGTDQPRDEIDQRNGIAQPAERTSTARNGSDQPVDGVGQARNGGGPPVAGFRPSARDGLAQPRNGTNQPGDGLGQRRNGIDQSGDGISSPRNGAGQPHDEAWPPREGLDQPRNGGGQPATGPDRPSYGAVETRNGAGQPRNGVARPRDGFELRRNGVAQPVDGLDPPRNGTAQPSGGPDQPRNGTAQSRGALDPPRATAPQSSGLDQPRHGTAQPSGAPDQPRHGTAQPSGGPDQPRHGAAQARKRSSQPRNGVAQPIDGVVQARNGVAAPADGIGQARAAVSSPRHSAGLPLDRDTPGRDRRPGTRGVAGAAGHRVDGGRATADRTGLADRADTADRTDLVARVDLAEQPTSVISDRGLLAPDEDRAADEAVSRPGADALNGGRDHGRRRRRAQPATNGAAPRRGAGTPPPAGRAARRAAAAAPPPRSFGHALLAALASTVVPGTGLLMIRRTRAGALVLGVFLLTVVALLLVGLTVRRSELVGNLLSSRVLLIVMGGLVLAGLAWIAQVVRTYVLARPHAMAVGRQLAGVIVVTALCLGVATPFAYAASIVNAQRALLDTLFAGNDGGTSVAVAIAKPRLNILLMGSDAGPDRTGARSDTMMVASIDTQTARTTLFGLPRNIGYAPFPPGSALATKFPHGFHDPDGNPTSGNYLLNAVYAYALEYPQLAPAGPTKDPGLNALNETVSTMLGIDLDYYVEVNMAGFASIIDAVGGVTVDVGPVALPIGGVLPNGVHVKPSGYVPAGVQHLTGDQALWFARSRRDSDDYNRMGRQRCLLQSVLAQKSPADVVGHFQEIASATSNSVSTNIPQEVVGQLVALVGEHAPTLQSVSFDPNLPDPSTGRGFDPNRPDYSFMKQVVQQAFNPATAQATATVAATETAAPKRAAVTDGTQTPADSANPEALVSSCG